MYNSKCVKITKSKNKVCLVLALVMLFFFTNNSFASEERPNDLYIYVAVSIVENPMSHKILEYFGKMRKSVYLDIVNNKSQDGFFQLLQVGWINKKSKYIHYKDMAYITGGAHHPYSATMYFRIKHITRLALLKNEFIKSVMAQ